MVSTEFSPIALDVYAQPQLTVLKPSPELVLRVYADPFSVKEVQDVLRHLGFEQYFDQGRKGINWENKQQDVLAIQECIGFVIQTLHLSKKRYEEELLVFLHTQLFHKNNIYSVLNRTYNPTHGNTVMDHILKVQQGIETDDDKEMIVFLKRSAPILHDLIKAMTLNSQYPEVQRDELQLHALLSGEIVEEALSVGDAKIMFSELSNEPDELIKTLKEIIKYHHAVEQVDKKNLTPFEAATFLKSVKMDYMPANFELMLADLGSSETHIRKFAEGSVVSLIAIVESMAELLQEKWELYRDFAHALLHFIEDILEKVAMHLKRIGVNKQEQDEAETLFLTAEKVWKKINDLAPLAVKNTILLGLLNNDTTFVSDVG